MVAFAHDEDGPGDLCAARARVLLDHVINLCDQLGRLKAMLAEQNIRAPEDLGQLGPAPDDVVERLTQQSLEKHFPGEPIPSEESPS